MVDTASVRKFLQEIISDKNEVCDLNFDLINTTRMCRYQVFFIFFLKNPTVICNLDSSTNSNKNSSTLKQTSTINKMISANPDLIYCYWLTSAYSLTIQGQSVLRFWTEAFGLKMVKVTVTMTFDLLTSKYLGVIDCFRSTLMQSLKIIGESVLELLNGKHLV